MNDLLSKIAYGFVKGNWEEFFGRKTLERGLAYAAEERVFGLKAQPFEGGCDLFSRVRGSGPVYRCHIEVSFHPQGLDFIGQCSCPVGYNCKHIVATFRELEVHHGSIKKAEETGFAGGDFEASKHLTEWLRAVQSSVGSPPERKNRDRARQEERALYYGFTVDQGDRGGICSLELMEVVWRRGRIEQVEDVDLESLEGGRFPGYFSEDDIRRTREMLQLAPHHEGGNFSPSGRFWAALIEEILKEEQSVWSIQID
ncbi:MAG: SWIM zinc finger family protein, partial [Verrucomicrobiota bacterium]